MPAEHGYQLNALARLEHFDQVGKIGGVQPLEQSAQLADIIPGKRRVHGLDEFGIEDAGLVMDRDFACRVAHLLPIA
jgi:hypothetical protein